MIAASEPKEFSPFGRQQLERHPGEVFPPSTQPPVLHPESHLLHRLSQVAISDEPQQSERWVLRAGPDDPQCEEELYVSGKTAVWSRRAFSAHPGSAVLQCCYSCETRIRHALWCSFRTSGADEPVGDPIPCICLVDADSIRVFTAEGEDYIVYLQFEVSHVWACKYGLILERTTHANTSSKDYFNDTEQPQLSTIFSLLHPLDEITPVIGKHGGLSYMNDPSVNIVFVSENPSVCMVYDSKLGAHSIWKIRKAQPEECRYVCGFAGPDEATEQSASSASAGFPGHSTSSRGRRLSLLSGRGAVLAGYSPQSSARSHSPAEGFSHLQSPSPLASPPDWLSGVLRLPQLGASWLSPANSPGSGSPGLSAESRLMTSEMSDPAASRPICPELCFQHVWQEGAGVSRESGGGAASKAFFSSDFVGQTYLCYLVVSRSRLYYTRLEKANIEQQLIFGLESSVPAADAVNVPQLQLVAVLDTAGGVSLYSGLSVVGKLHVAGIHSALTTSSYLSLFGTHFASPCLPKRSSLILTSSLVGTHSRSTPATEPSFDEGVHLLSPVEPQGSEGNVKITPSTPLRGQLVALRDSVANRLSLEYSDGSMFRIALPDLCTSPLVARSVEALQLVLQRDLAMQLAVRWYGVRNAPGTRDLSPAHEWELFADTLLELLGYDVEKLAGAGARDPDRPSVLAKRRRSSEGGTPGDWHLLQGSAHHRALSWGLGALLGLQCAGAAPDTVAGDAGGSETGRVSSAAPLFCSAPLVLFTLHLLYQDLKLNVLLYEGLPLLARLLHQLAGDLRLPEYVQHYWRDFPRHCALAPARESQFQDADLKKLANLNAVPMEPPDIFQHLHDMLLGQECVPYPYISRLNKTSKNIVQLVALRTYGYEDPHLAVEGFVKLNVPLGKVGDPEEVTSARDSYPSAKYPMPHRAVLLMTELGVTRQDLQVLPAGVAFLVQDLVYQSRADPPLDWPRAAYCLVGREDLAAQCLGPAESSPEARDARRQDVAKMAEVDQEDGMDGMEFEVLRLLFSKDHRVAEVRRLLQSSQPVSIGITQRPDVSDHEFIEEQEKQLYALCTRTMAIPVGRGMFTLRSVSPVVTEPLPIPRLCLTGRAPPRGTTVDLTHIEVVPNMNLWPSFHNGVAAGLRIATHASNIASDWIIFNKPKGTAEVPVEHAGFLMALGLNGHLGNLMVFNKYEYLARCHEITSVGLLLGVAATKRGTMDLATTKMLSVHLEAFLPPTSIELDVPQNIQVAALLSIGLVYEGTAHRHTAEVLLAEIGRPPGPEMENSVDRESYSLAAGLALGLVMLGKGSRLCGLGDLAVPDTLHYYMVGGHRRPLTGAQKEKYKSPSYQIREGDAVNIDVTSPGATLALGMMYFNTGNTAAADWMKAPDTQYLLDFVRPDFLMLRVIARALILWEDIVPSRQWVASNVPQTIMPYCLVKPRPGAHDNVDYETMNQAYCNIVAGACMAIGLRFAGSANNLAFETLLKYAKMFTSLSAKSIAELAGKSTIETCLNVILLSLAMVMAGTGELEVLRMCRYLRSRVGPTNSVVTYGSHLAAHMALGLLFLGAGRYTLSTAPSAVAAMICAFFPKFPTHSNDNRYHLQALRHLYVLAVEPRLLLPRDIGTGEMCYVHLRVVFLDTAHYHGQAVRLRAPCLLPELGKLCEVRVEDDRYWSIVFHRERNWDQLIDLLQRSHSLDVKLRIGCLSYTEDPQGFRSLLAHALISDKTVPWFILPDSIREFSSDPALVSLTQHLLQPGAQHGRAEQELVQLLTVLVYKCVTEDKLCAVPLWVSVLEALRSLQRSPQLLPCWQLKLLRAQFLARPVSDLVAVDVALSLEQRLGRLLQSWEPELEPVLKEYVSNNLSSVSSDVACKLASYLTLRNIPSQQKIMSALEGECRNPLVVHKKLQKYGLSAAASLKISQFRKCSAH
ncbi:anaphase-promoting complex subunit 1 isoform X1 [Bacillus rossius redtenbacheri]|uniref:anaphase-promoting complex subunit 1 isoform X1 n=1 Tax=Bacillus rossius redtenbacheri TaxID=93214 RepID=UPI002FDD8B5F